MAMSRKKAKRSQRSNNASKWLQALTDTALVRASSSAIFGRGMAYAKAGAVEVISEDPMPAPAARARVVGSDTYTTEVRIEDGLVAGDCDCPNAADGWFCKHQVAVALVWRERRTADAPDTNPEARRGGRSAKSIAKRAKSDRELLLDFLRGLEGDVLAAKVMELADHHRDIERELQQWRRSTEVHDDPDSLRALIGDMLAPGRDFIAWNESYAYVRRARAVFPLLEQARSRDPSTAADLSLHALRHAWNVLQHADDSNGDIGGFCQAIGAEWVRALQAAGPQPRAFGEIYLQIVLQDPFGTFDADAAETAIGKAAMARFRDVVAQRWRRAKDAMMTLRAKQAAQRGRRNGRAPVYATTSNAEVELGALERLHLAQLEKTNQIDAALAVLREDLATAYDHSRVVSFLERYRRFGAALVHAEHGCKAFPEDWRLQDDLLRCYEREGRMSEALVIRRRQFERSPSVERFHATLKAARADKQDVRALRQTLIEFMTALEVEAGGRRALHFGRPPPGTDQTTGIRDVSLRAEVLCSEGQWIEACALVQPPAACRNQVLLLIARHLPAEQKEQALALLIRVFRNSMTQASSPYRVELALVKEIGRLMDPARRAAWLESLRAEYKAKRNFVRDLPMR